MSDDPEERFLVLAPTGRDAELTCRLLADAGMHGIACDDLEGLLREAARGAAALMFAEEVLRRDRVQRVAAYLAGQEPWSDLPIVVFTATHPGAARGIDPRTVEGLGNVTLLDRPLRPITMVSAARAALRARRRQYAARAVLARQREAVAQRDAFLAMLGHELRNPLSTITLAGELLERTGDVRRHGDAIRRQVRHLTRLVDDLLDVGRVTTGKVVLKRQPLELDELVERVAASVRPKLGARTLVLDVRRDETPIHVDADPVRLEQVVGNLLTNAVKYSDADGRVEVRLRRDGSWAVLEVQDDGFGISPPMLRRVFDLFAQAEETTDRSQGGLGIGLTLVKALVEQHGGSVVAESAGRGAGSTFTVRLPRLEAEPPAQEVAAPCLPGGRLRVLIVEDRADARELLQEVVSHLGHDVTGAPDGIQGVARAGAVRPHVMLVDIGLPGLDGYEVARRARRLLGHDVHLVALTGYGQPEDRARAHEAGFDQHWTKPVDVPALARLLGELAAQTSTRAGVVDPQAL